MTTVLTVAAVVIAILVAVMVGFVIREKLRRDRLRRRFGPEYERELSESHDHRAVERELTDRERRHAGLEIHPVPAEVRHRYATRWTEVQGRFVDFPGPTVMDADRLVTSLMAERGYPTEDYRQQLADLSVEHAKNLDHYREAHRVMERSVAGEASTEDLRLAMRHYRVLFEDLLGPEPDQRAAGAVDGDATGARSPGAESPASGGRPARAGAAPRLNGTPNAATRP
ncbi:MULTISPECIES: hypothetical protein [Actinoalloteichus]|uniref:Secreted protein n=1 Tax=Actinoalloteichus fjordicus TaxID=1612552 RepID=A0AAC9LF59_9PSEU|nr:MULTISPECIES: hypothetical protein [Actinoalloteichus]APU16723.1 hypothetical protein UA74_23525 [Actinoalloteichus fjordicus]APU22789.1 hypothetical protein UA75_24035 [Actinoalloteichus sp. GBA129-24]